MEVMGIPVDDHLFDRWIGWFAPVSQPFLTTGTAPPSIEMQVDGRPLADELLDTFELYGTSGRFRLAWFDEQAFMALDQIDRASLVRSQVRHGRSLVPAVRRWRSELGGQIAQQADRHRFVWWPSLVVGRERDLLSEFVTGQRPPSRHRDVPHAIWKRADGLLSGVAELAGTFPDRSGPNCFGAVMAAAGVDGAAEAMMERAPFETWLANSTRPGGNDAAVGTVFVWRNSDGVADHAAVTIGAGWAFHKPSVGWMSPFMVLPVDELKRVSRHPGLRLHRSTITN